MLRSGSSHSITLYTPTPLYPLASFSVLARYHTRPGSREETRRGSCFVRYLLGNTQIIDGPEESESEDDGEDYLDYVDQASASRCTLALVHSLYNYDGIYGTIVKYYSGQVAIAARRKLPPRVTVGVIRGFFTVCFAVFVPDGARPNARRGRRA